MAVITISREVGSGGDQIARRVCELLEYRYFDRVLMAEVARGQGISETRGGGLLGGSLPGAEFHRRPVEAVGASCHHHHGRHHDQRGGNAGRPGRRRRHGGRLRVSDDPRAADAGKVVVVGRGGQAILRDASGVLHVRIIARLEDRVRQVGQADGLTREAAHSEVEERDRATAEYLRRFHRIDWADPSLYHLTLNTSLLGHDAAADVIAATARRQ